MEQNARQVRLSLSKLADPERALTSARFFKTARGQYGYGDKFLGMTVPQQRKVAQEFFDLNLTELAKLIASGYHEHRLTALLILNDQFRRAGQTKRVLSLMTFYIQYLPRINNWDLVDISADKILGNWLLLKNQPRSARQILYTLADFPDLWFRRTAVVATLALIRRGQFDDTLKLAKRLLGDPEDLIHKATGWMLREVGRRDPEVLRNFLKTNVNQMPRTMLRYAIEKFAPPERQTWLRTK